MKWKKWAWAGLGSMVLGTVAVLAGKRLQRRAAQVTGIPESVDSFVVETEPHQVLHRGQSYSSTTSYLCRATPFRVWSILHPSSQGEGDSGGHGGQRIYHVAPTVRIRSASGEEAQVIAEEKFYGTLHLKVDPGKPLLDDQLGCGYHLVFRICHAGGSLNGVPTGEELIAGSPIGRFELVSTSGS